MPLNDLSLSQWDYCMPPNYYITYLQIKTISKLSKVGRSATKAIAYHTKMGVMIAIYQNQLSITLNCRRTIRYLPIFLPCLKAFFIARIFNLSVNSFLLLFYSTSSSSFIGSIDYFYYMGPLSA